MICWYPEWLKTWSTYLFLGFFKTVDSQTHTELHGMRCDLAPHKEKLGTRETGKLWTIRKQSWLILWLLVDSAPCEELCQVSGGCSSLGQNLPGPADILQGCQPSKGQVFGARRRKGWTVMPERGRVQVANSRAPTRKQEQCGDESCRGLRVGPSLSRIISVFSSSSSSRPQNNLRAPILNHALPHVPLFSSQPEFSQLSCFLQPPLFISLGIQMLATTVYVLFFLSVCFRHCPCFRVRRHASWNVGASLPQ